MQVAFGFADVLADHRRQVEPVQRYAEAGGEDQRGKRLAGARWPGEQRAHAGVEASGERWWQCRPQAIALAAARFEVVEVAPQIAIKDQRVPVGVAGCQAPGKAVEFGRTAGQRHFAQRRRQLGR